MVVVCVCVFDIVVGKCTWLDFFSPTSRLGLYEGIQFNSVNVYQAPTTFQAPVQKPGLQQQSKHHLGPQSGQEANEQVKVNGNRCS